MIELNIEKISNKNYLKVQSMYDSYFMCKYAIEKIQDKRVSMFPYYLLKDTKWRELMYFYAKLVKYDVEKLKWFEKEYK